LDQINKLFPIPVLSSARIVKDSDSNLIIQSQWVQKNIVTQTKLKTRCTQHVNMLPNVEIGVSTPRFTPLNDNVVFSSYHADHDLIVEVVEQEDKEGGAKGDNKRHLLVMEAGKAPHIIPLHHTKLHGKVYSDPELGSVSVSPDSTKIAFIAEEYQPPQSDVLSQESTPRNKFLWKEDWGEQMSGQSKAVLVIVPTHGRSASDEDRQLITPDKEVVGLGDICWVSNEEVVCVAYLNQHPRLGLVYCPNRDSVLLKFNLKDNTTQRLTPAEGWVGSPRLLPCGKRLVFLAGPKGGPHVNAARLVLLHLSEGEEGGEFRQEILLDYTNTEPIQGLDSPTARLFSLCGATLIPQRCFVDDDRLCLTTPCDNRLASFCIDITTRQISLMACGRADEERFSLVLHDVCSNKVLYCTSGFFTPHALHIATLNTGHNQVHAWLSQPGSTTKLQPTTLVEFEHKFSAGFKFDSWHLAIPTDEYRVPVLFCVPKHSNGPLPLVVYIHGGPHSAVMNSWSSDVTALLSLGYAVVLPNYAGSLGSGKAGIEALPGRAGELDVEQCHQAAVECLERYAEELDPANVFLKGGSHGGFLVTHLAAYKPDFYRAVSTRNPVTDIATMVGQTDIPDWTFVESVGESRDFAHGPPRPDQLTAMLSKSPIAHVDKVTAPTLLLLGSKDRRVPCSQGIRYHQMLLHRGVPTKLYVYPDCHSLATVLHEAECLVHCVEWFREHQRE